MQLQQVARCPLPAARCQLQVARVKSIHIRTADSCRLSIAAAAASVVVSGRLAEWDFDFAEREQTEIDRACPRLTPSLSRPSNASLGGFIESQTKQNGLPRLSIFRPPALATLLILGLFVPPPTAVRQIPGTTLESETGRQTERQRWRQIRMQLQLQLKAAQNCNFKNKVYAFQNDRKRWQERVEKRESRRERKIV